MALTISDKQQSLRNFQGSRSFSQDLGSDIQVMSDIVLKQEIRFLDQVNTEFYLKILADMVTKLAV